MFCGKKSLANAGVLFHVVSVFNTHVYVYGTDIFLHGKRF